MSLARLKVLSFYLIFFFCRSIELHYWRWLGISISIYTPFQIGFWASIPFLLLYLLVCDFGLLWVALE